jgi:cytochrome c553
MQAPASALDDNAIRNLSAYYVTQQPQPTKVRKPLTSAEWAQRCDRCHGINGNSTDPRSPALAGQRVEYLEKVLHAYRTGARRSPPMAAMSAVLTEEDVENLAAHYARQQARAFVYVKECRRIQDTQAVRQLRIMAVKPVQRRIELVRRVGHVRSLALWAAGTLDHDSTRMRVPRPRRDATANASDRASF